MVNLSVLDLCPVISGEPAAQALQDTLSLATFVENLGATRYWVAEHHSMAGIASASPEIIIGHIAQATRRIRVGSGGIMLPNHAPLRIAEAFRTLEAFHPGRIDLGVGRAPGTNTTTTLALRGGRDRLRAENFPQELADLKTLLASHFTDSPYEEVVAMPSIKETPELWMLGSSDFGARVAAELGLPYAFAQHFSPLPAAGVLNLYRRNFLPSETLQQPKAIIAVHIVCGETDVDARRLALPSDIAFYRYRSTGRNIPLPTFAEALEAPLTPTERARLQTMSVPKFVGSPETLRRELSAFITETHVDELLVLTMIPELAERKKSYARTGDVLKSL